MFVCVMSSQSTSKKPHYVSDTSKRGALLHKTHQCSSGTKVPKLDLCKSILSLSKIAHQMCHDHQLSQRNRATERTVGVGLEVRRKLRGLTKFESRVGVKHRQYRGDLHKIRGLAPLW